MLFIYLSWILLFPYPLPQVLKYVISAMIRQSQLVAQSFASKKIDMTYELLCYKCKSTYT